MAAGPVDDDVMHVDGVDVSLLPWCSCAHAVRVKGQFGYQGLEGLYRFEPRCLFSGRGIRPSLYHPRVGHFLGGMFCQSYQVKLASRALRKGRGSASRNEVTS